MTGVASEHHIVEIAAHAEVETELRLSEVLHLIMRDGVNRDAAVPFRAQAPINMKDQIGDVVVKPLG